MGDVCNVSATNVTLPIVFGGKLNDGLRNTTQLSCEILGLKDVLVYVRDSSVVRLQVSTPRSHLLAQFTHSAGGR